MYTVRQLATLAGVSVRTLHYYDQIGLLAPSQVAANGYRFYDDAAVLRLQQILFYRELGMELLAIKAVLDHLDFDLLAALHSHRAQLATRIDDLHHLLDTVDRTISHLNGEMTMSKKQLFKGFSKKEQAQHERVARLQYGPDIVNESMRRWNGYTTSEQAAIMAQGNTLYEALAAALQAGSAPASPEVQQLLTRWHEHLRYFYEPSFDILRGLGDLYQDNEQFAANFRKLHPELPGFLQLAISAYVDAFEDAELARLLAADEGDQPDKSENAHSA